MALAASSSSPLTLRRIVQIYWPLGLSWLFMAMEGQAAMWLVGRMPDPKINQAGLLIVFSLAIFIESPVIDLLSTSTTLGISKSRFAELTRFSLLLMGWVTLIHALVMFTPLYSLVAEGILGAKPEVAAAAWPGLAWMTLWSAGVGWRRYLQGFMIRAGVTRPITLGTFIRVGALLAIGVPLSLQGNLPSLGVVGAGLLVAVWAEAIYIHFVSRPVVRNLPVETKTGPETMGMLALSRFHFPLTLSTMVMLTAPLFVSRALTSSPEPIVAMAAWQVASTLTWLFRTVTFAMPEAVISLYQAGAEKILGRFCFFTGAGLTLVMLGTHFAGLDRWIFVELFGTEGAVTSRSTMAFLFLSPMPLLGGMMSYYRGVLTACHITWARLLAIGVSIGSLVFGLWMGTAAGWLGIAVAGVAVTLAQGMEVVSLAASWRIFLRKAGRSAEVGQN